MELTEPMTSRSERRLLRRRVNHIKDLARDTRQRTVVAVALALGTAFAGNAFAHDTASVVYYVAVVVLATLTIIVSLAALASRYFYHKAVNSYREDKDA